MSSDRVYSRNAQTHHESRVELARAAGLVHRRIQKIQLMAHYLISFASTFTKSVCVDALGGNDQHVVFDAFLEQRRFQLFQRTVLNLTDTLFADAELAAEFFQRAAIIA